MPRPVAAAFLADWAGGRFAVAARQTDGKPKAVAAALTAFGDGVDATSAKFSLAGVSANGSKATARFRAQIGVAGLGLWSYSASLTLRRRADGKWLVVWRLADLNPSLAGGDRLVALRSLPVRAPLLDRSGAQLQPPTPVVTVGVVPALLKPRKKVLATLAKVLGLDLAALTRQVAHFPRNDFLAVITLRQSAYDRVKPIIYPLIGVHFQSSELPLGPTPGYGQAVLGDVGPATAQALSNAGPLALGSDVIGLSGLQFVYQRRLAGTPSGSVKVLNTAGHTVATLMRVAAHEAEPVKTTLSVPLQTAAERALPQHGKPMALVAVQASTGQILAIANRPRSDYDLALDGADPPGSTFKVITTATLLAHGFDPATPVPCPPSITVDGKVFTNFQGESAAGASFEQDFAQSCNAAFISLYGRLGPSDLSTEAAQQFGFGTQWQLPLAYYSGQAPPAAGTVEQAADMIGQGRILASPLNMALVAAAVDSGAWHPPTLVTAPAVPAAAPGSGGAPPGSGGAPPGSGGAPAVEARPLPASIVTELQTLMRAVVTSGTGTAANLPGVPVYGKTGTAEFGTANPPRTDAWFIGYRGDLAFAVVVQGGGVGGQVAAPIAARFLQDAAGVSVP